MDNLQKKVITIAELSQKDNRVVIKDQDGISYSFFVTKQDGNQSKAYESMLSGGLKVNSTTEISYSLNGKYKNIAYFNRPSEKSAASVPPFVSGKELEKKESETVLGKCRTLLAVEAFKLRLPLDVKTATEINAWANYCVNGKLAQVIQEEDEPYSFNE